MFYTAMMKTRCFKIFMYNFMFSKKVSVDSFAYVSCLYIDDDMTVMTTFKCNTKSSPTPPPLKKKF